MDLKRVCRTCLRIPKKSTSLFQGDSNIVQRIQAISSVEIENNAELSTIICEECLENINHFYNFQKVIKNTDQDLRFRLETLTNSSYNIKPRSKLEEQIEVIKIDIKSEIDVDINKESYIPELGISLKKALAMRKLFKCNHCNDLFNSKAELCNHRRKKHVATGICNICGLKVRADNLRKHIKLHSEEPCKCEQCGRILKNSESLRSHKLLHLKDTYTCEICGRTFKLKNEHTRHLKQHQDPDSTKMTCSVCGKKIRNRKKHMRTHTGERPFSCSFCKKDFTSSYALKVHTRQHTNERPYECNYCNSSFTQKVSLTTHIKSKHA